MRMQPNAIKSTDAKWEQRPLVLEPREIPSRWRLRTFKRCSGRKDDIPLSVLRRFGQDVSAAIPRDATRRVRCA
jgi:hypothetical protein